MSAAASEPPPRRGPRLGAASRVLREPLGAFGLALVVLVLGASVLADALATADPTRLSPMDRFQGPSAAHPLGTDQLGRDLLARVLHGGRIALTVASGPRPSR